MKISDKGLDMLKVLEGVRLNAYKAVSTEKYYTIGYGHYGADVAPNTTISLIQAEDMLKKDIKKYEDAVNKYDPIYRWTQNEFDAIVIFAYNLGTGSLKQLTDYGSRSKSVIYSKIALYNKSGGKILKGLVKRRQAEQRLFLEGVYYGI